MQEFLQIMEGCLRHDFDGFEIILEDTVAAGLRLPAPWHHSAIEQCWSSSEEEISMKMGVYRATGERLGTISLLQNARLASGIDAGLISGAFLDAVALAVENVILQSKLDVRRNEYLSDQPQLAPLQAASVEPA